jgi:lipopolysaccharide export system permease protein
MPLIDRYIFRQTVLACFFVIAVLTTIVFLMQSLRFIDLVINAGAPGIFIWLQTLLYLPSALEIIIPIGCVAGILFIYNRLTMDSELIVLRALGFSPLRLARPGLILASMLGIGLWGSMGWISPASKSAAYTMRQDIRAHMTSLIFREGIFNEAGKGLMVYIRERDKTGRLKGLIIHDSRDAAKSPSTIIARSGILVSTPMGQQVLVYDGSRQEVDSKTGVMRRLDFTQYTIDLPEQEKGSRLRTPEVEERSTSLLISSLEKKDSFSLREIRQMRVELQKRFLLPFLVPGFAVIGLSFLLFGGHERRGQGRRVVMAVSAVVLLQILFLVSYNLAKQSPFGFPMMLLTVLLPYIVAIILFQKDNLMKSITSPKPYMGHRVAS